MAIILQGGCPLLLPFSKQPLLGCPGTSIVPGQLSNLENIMDNKELDKILEEEEEKVLQESGELHEMTREKFLEKYPLDETRTEKRLRKEREEIQWPRNSSTDSIAG